MNYKRNSNRLDWGNWRRPVKGANWNWNKQNGNLKRKLLITSSDAANWGTAWTSCSIFSIELRPSSVTSGKLGNGRSICGAMACPTPIAPAIYEPICISGITTWRNAIVYHVIGLFKPTRAHCWRRTSMLRILPLPRYDSNKATWVTSIRSGWRRC